MKKCTEVRFTLLIRIHWKVDLVILISLGIGVTEDFRTNK